MPPNLKVAATTPERWKKIEALYHASLETQGEERDALLSHADPEVRRAVEALLLHDPAHEGILDRPAWELAGAPREAPRTQLVPGERLGPYRIDSWIGSGGMGDVYRATDERLNRIVAIKVATAQFSARFEREARTIAALNHPNICQIYDIGANYLVMEYLTGSPVVSGDQPPMTRDKALPIALQMAAAIEAAHAKGIVHRDLKPANILVSDEGMVKLLDFGIAKQSSALGSASKTASVTHIGMIMGTPAYMSPEQAEGHTADVRSDIFSFGAILYEMLAGKRAFPGASAASTLGAVLHRTPDALAAPPQLRAVVLKCLEKSPVYRYQTASELKAALERPAARDGSYRLAVAAGLVALLIVSGASFYLWQRGKVGTINSIAVLPLDIQSNDPEADYIGDGIAESINNRLARVPGMKVIPNSVALQYKGHAAEFQKVGDSLGVDAVLSGRALLHGDELTVNIELNDVRRGTQLWGQQYTRKVADLLALQNDVSREVSQRLRVGLSANDQEKISLGTTNNPEAYQLFLKGEYYTAKFTREGFDKGIDYLNRAIALDPGYAQAHSALAYNYINQDDWFLPPSDSAPKARAAALKALSFEEADVQAHVVLGIENDWYEWNWDAADREFRRAIELDPESGDARGYYSWFLPSMGRNEEALAQAREQTRAAPLSTGANGNLGSVLVFTHRWNEAIAQLRSAIDLNPNYWFDYLFLGRAYEQTGQYAAAIGAFKKGLELEGNTELWGGLGHAYAMAGKATDAQEVLTRLEEMSKTRYVAPYNVALIHLGLGDKDATFEWLEHAYEARSYLLAIYLNTDARLSPLYADLRYQSLLRRMKLSTPK